MIYKRIRYFNRCVSLRHLQWGNRSFSMSNHAVIDEALRDGELRVFIVAGEVSGDSIGSRFMDSLKKLSPIPVKFCGVGGCMMSKQGLSHVFPMEDISVMGIWELLPHLYKFRVRLKQAISAALSFHPHVVVTVDSKGFSFRFLKEFKVRCAQQGFLGPPHFHYVAPSFWAWKGGEARLKKLSSFIDHVLCILPFEAKTCRSHGLDATFVGHPTLEDVLDFEGMDYMANRGMVQGNGEEFKTEHGISSGFWCVACTAWKQIARGHSYAPHIFRGRWLL
ncbi:hypothetical protein Leryth_005332 [Lithospermum erythrorhizon]|nr:hypothetical protein Leryth_005332 [Lithospermum erythrorhizon]